MNARQPPVLRPLLLVPIAAGLVMLALGRTGGGVVLVVLGLLRLHLVLVPDVDEGIEYLHYGEDDAKGSAALKQLEAADSALGAEV